MRQRIKDFMNKVNELFLWIELCFIMLYVYSTQLLDDFIKSRAKK